MEPKDLARICGPGNKKSGREAAAFQPYLFLRVPKGKNNAKASDGQGKVLSL
jgi:hypothetical protein